MATIEQETAHRESLYAQLGHLTSIDENSLVRADELGQVLSFREGLPYFRRVLRLFRDLAEANLDTLPSSQLHSLTNIAQQANNQFTQIREFSLRTRPQNPAQARDNLINSIRDHYDSWFNEVAPIIAYSVRKGTDFERLEEEAREQAARVEQIRTELQSKSEGIIHEVSAVLEQVRRIAQEVGVAKHAVQFKAEADRHKTAANKWLNAVIGLAIGTAVMTLLNIGLFFYFFEETKEIKTAQTIQLAVAKVLLFSLFFSALVWAGRVYRSHQHNFVVNQHRRNALTSFETFAKAANDEQTKSAVLLQSTNCIFSAQPSGYADTSADATGSPRIMEIIRNIATAE